MNSPEHLTFAREKILVIVQAHVGLWLKASMIAVRDIIVRAGASSSWFLPVPRQSISCLIHPRGTTYGGSDVPPAIFKCSCSKLLFRWLPTAARSLEPFLDTYDTQPLAIESRRSTLPRDNNSRKFWAHMYTATIQIRRYKFHVDVDESGS